MLRAGKVNVCFRLLCIYDCKVKTILYFYAGVIVLHIRLVSVQTCHKFYDVEQFCKN